MLILVISFAILYFTIWRPRRFRFGKGPFRDAVERGRKQAEKKTPPR